MSLNTNQTLDTVGATKGKLYQVAGSTTTSPISASSGVVQLYAYTTGSTSVKMGFDAGQALSQTAPAGRFSLEDNSVYYVEGMLVAERGNYANNSTTGPVCYSISFMVQRGNGANTTQLNGTPVITKKFGADNSNMSTGNVSVTADTGNGNVDINVNGEFATIYRWSGSFTYVRSSST